MIGWMGLVAGAWADSVTYPEVCPPGSVGRASHSPYCAPAGCDETCPAEDCRPAGLCVIEYRTTYYDTGGRTWQEALSTCEAQADCDPDATCVIEDRCVPEEPKVAEVCGCDAPSAGSAGMVLVALGLLAGRPKR